jgi:hypothetical protein
MKKSSRPPNKAFGAVAKKPEADMPGKDRGQFSKMPAGPMAHKARAGRLKGVKI